MSLTIVGSMAFDDIETPKGKSGKIIGGAGTYIAWAASKFLTDLNMISIVGNDFPEEELQALSGQGINLDGVEIEKNKKSFYWSGRYHQDMNTRDTLVTELNVLEDFRPKLDGPAAQSDFLMLGNLNPGVQFEVLNQMQKRPRLIALDTMNFWMDIALEELKKVLARIGVLIINDSEARQLSGEDALAAAAKKIFEMGPRYLIIKKGEHGALLFHKDQIFAAPALPLEEVFDPTGAGDTFAGGFMGYLAHTGKTSFESMKTAIIAGSVLASFCVEKFGVQRLKEIDKTDIKRRFDRFVELSGFNPFLE